MATVPRFRESGFTTTPERSAQMSKIRAKETKMEVALRKAIWQTGLRYRKNVKRLPGTPDIVFGKYKLAVFVDGDFWHGHNWDTKKHTFKTNREFWIPKIERNMERDAQNNVQLQSMGYKVLRFWENEVKKDVLGCVLKVVKSLK